MVHSLRQIWPRASRSAARAAVQVAIRDVLNKELPTAYTTDLYEQKCEQVFQHIYDTYADAAHSVYAA